MTGYYLEYISERLADVEAQNTCTLETALVKKELFDNIQISAFRFRALCNHILDHICLQEGFDLQSISALESLVSYVVSKGLTPCMTARRSVIFFVSEQLLNDRALLDRFCHSAANTSSLLSGEIMIVVIHETVVPEYLASHPDFKYTTVSEDSSLASLEWNSAKTLVIAKSMIALRAVAVDLYSIDQLKPIELRSAASCCATGVTQPERRQNFICMRDLINQKLVELCLHITRVLTVVTYEDKKNLEAVGLSDDQDRSIVVAISYAVQVLLESSSSSKAFQGVFVEIVLSGLKWINFHIQQYLNGVDVDWSVLYLIKILEGLNSLFTQTSFNAPKSWEQYYDLFAVHVQKFEATSPKTSNPNLHSYILDQAHFFLSLVHQDSIATAVPETQLRYPEQRILEAKHYYIFGILGQTPNIVYKCLDLVTRRMVVIKKLGLKVKDEKCTEVEFLKTLNHPNIVRYIKTFMDNSNLFLVMEHCEDTIELGALKLSEERGLPEDEVRVIGRQILLGLGYLHSNYIVHRDIKPSNILKTGSGFIKIADFGEAQFITGQEPSNKFDMNSLYGTPQFMAPECLHIANVKRKADIWSFGCVLAYLISGKMPWNECDNKFNVLYKLGSSQELPVNIESLDCNEDCKAVLRSILQIDPAARPTAFDLLSMDYFSKSIDSLI